MPFCWKPSDKAFKVKPIPSAHFLLIHMKWTRLFATLEIPRKLTTSFRDKLTTKSYFTI